MLVLWMLDSIFSLVPTEINLYCSIDLLMICYIELSLVLKVIDIMYFQ